MCCSVVGFFDPKGTKPQVGSFTGQFLANFVHPCSIFEPVLCPCNTAIVAALMLSDWPFAAQRFFVKPPRTMLKHRNDKIVELLKYLGLRLLTCDIVAGCVEGVFGHLHQFVCTFLEETDSQDGELV